MVTKRSTAAKKARAQKQEIARAKREASVIPDLIFWIVVGVSVCLPLQPVMRTPLGMMGRAVGRGACGCGCGCAYACACAKVGVTRSTR